MQYWQILSFAQTGQPALQCRHAERLIGGLAENEQGFTTTSVSDRLGACLRLVNDLIMLIYTLEPNNGR